MYELMPNDPVAIFIVSIPNTRFFQPDGDPDPAWKMFTAPTWRAARELSMKGWKPTLEVAADIGIRSAMIAVDRANGLHPNRDDHDLYVRRATGLVWRDVARCMNKIAAPLFNEGTSAHWLTVHAAQWDARLQVWTLAARDLDIPQQHRDHAAARWRVWEKGYALLGDVDGVLYVYAAPLELTKRYNVATQAVERG